MIQTPLFGPDNGQPSGEDFEAKAFFEALAEQLLAGYVEGIKGRARAPSPKEINDTVWQTIAVRPFEVVILDSPLLQRLRHIKQLGVAHYVYPGAAHTRLEHSVGVMHQMQCLIDAINDSLNKRVIALEEQHLLRVIALCHDVGHGAMSHVSENAIRQYDQVEDIELDFAEAVGVEKAKLGEIASYYMIGSPAFQTLLDAARTLAPSHAFPQDAVGKIQDAIIGKCISHKVPLLNELISGPFDADKLDYMTRDAHMAGVPVVTDITRLIRKVRAVEVSADDLPEDIAKNVDKEASHIVTGVALSGGRTLDELMLGRTLLFDKIYRHQKVRAAEAVVGSLLRALAAATGSPPAALPYLLDDDELLLLDDSKIAALSHRGIPAEGDSAAIATALADQLRKRQLFVRAFAFAHTMPLDPRRHSKEQRVGLEALARDARDSQKRSEIVRAVVAELRNILTLLGKSDLLPADGAEFFVVLDPPSDSPPGGDVPRAYLVTPSGQLTRFRDDAAETRGWADAYLLTRDIGYVFCPEQLAPYAWIACQRVVRDRYNVQVPSSMLAYAKQDPTLNRDITRELSKKGYYRGLPHDLRPLPARLQKADVDKAITQVLERVRGYQGPVPLTHTVTKTPLGPAHVKDWLRQFESDELIDQAIEMLRHLDLLGRDTIVGALNSLTVKDPEFNRAVICPLGTLKDSAAIAAYYARDLGKQVLSIQDALVRRGDDPLILLDDFVGSGQQAVTIVENWLGVEPSIDLGEERGDPLSDGAIEILKKRKVAFVFGGAMSEGPDFLKARCADLGLAVDVHAQRIGNDLPRAFANDRWPALRARCEEIGKQLVAKAKPEKRAERVLGYGNQALLVLFPYNTPTQTLTCLWESGTVDGVPWVPLFPRRKKT